MISPQTSQEQLGIHRRKRLFGSFDLDSVVDAARLQFCSTFEFKIFFTMAIVLAVAECFIVSFEPIGLNYIVQIIILALSSSLVFVDFMALIFYMDSVSLTPMTLSEKLVQIVSTAPVGVDIIYISIGWIFLFMHPGLAALRCFRVFRMLWYFEMICDDKPDDYDPSEHFFSISQSCQICLVYLERLGQELFTAKSKGAVVVLLMYFFMTYVLAIVFWLEFGNLNTSEIYGCHSMDVCFITLMRLTLYDGIGLDFLSGVLQSGGRSANGFGFLLILYMCCAAMILLNGLIGIFGSAFSEEVKPPIKRQRSALAPNSGKYESEAQVDFDNSGQRIKEGADTATAAEVLAEDVRHMKNEIAEMKELLINLSAQLGESQQLQHAVTTAHDSRLRQFPPRRSSRSHQQPYPHPVPGYPTAVTSSSGSGGAGAFPFPHIPDISHTPMHVQPQYSGSAHHSNGDSLFHPNPTPTHIVDTASQQMTQVLLQQQLLQQMQLLQMQQQQQQPSPDKTMGSRQQSNSFLPMDPFLAPHQTHSSQNHQTNQYEHECEQPYEHSHERNDSATSHNHHFTNAHSVAAGAGPASPTTPTRHGMKVLPVSNSLQRESPIRHHKVTLQPLSVTSGEGPQVAGDDNRIPPMRVVKNRIVRNLGSL